MVWNPFAGWVLPPLVLLVALAQSALEMFARHEDHRADYRRQMTPSARQAESRQALDRLQKLAAIATEDLAPLTAQPIQLGRARDTFLLVQSDLDRMLTLSVVCGERCILRTEQLVYTLRDVVSLIDRLRQIPPGAPATLSAGQIRTLQFRAQQAERDLNALLPALERSRAAILAAAPEAVSGQSPSG